MVNKSHAPDQNIPHGLTTRNVVEPHLDDALLFKEGFPIYDNLSSLLCKAEHHPDATVAHVLAVCAGYAYSDAETVTLMMKRMGLENCVCRAISVRVDAMFIISTAYVIQSEDGSVVIVAYRGTEPANFINWLTDADLTLDKVKFTFDEKEELHDVHAGFYRNFRATRSLVFEALESARLGQRVTDPPDPSKPKPENAMKALYVTGHSLGAAMAAIMGITIQTEQDNNLRDVLKAVYTFGQPMIGSKELADACTKNTPPDKEMIRIIYRNDPIPHVPPVESGPKWKHFGREYQFGDNSWEKNPEPAGQMRARQLLGAVIAFILRLIPALRRIPFKYQFNDHGPQHYIEALTNREKPTEFGDRDYAPLGKITPIDAVS